MIVIDGKPKIPINQKSTHLEKCPNSEYSPNKNDDEALYFAGDEGSEFYKVYDNTKDNTNDNQVD
jgi:hypothetical protein